VADAAFHSDCRSIAFTYNDPVIFAEYAIDCAVAAHEQGLKTVAVTAGYISPAARSDFYAHIDAANVDLKAFTQTFYHKVCFANLGPVLDTLSWLKHETEVWIEVTTLLIPGQNDSPGEVAQLCDWFVENLGPDVPLHFTAFHPDFKMRDIHHTSLAALRRARQQALSAGLHHVYTGNVHDVTGQSTYCASCQEILIERNWFELGRWQINEIGGCRVCGAKLAGHFDPRPGTWGRAGSV
jgi:pyruvate formate lyase activating enzyme